MFCLKQALFETCFFISSPTSHHRSLSLPRTGDKCHTQMKCFFLYSRGEKFESASNLIYTFQRRYTYTLKK